MIKDYLYAIGKYLPPSQKDEVLKEIQSNLYDYMEENYGEKENYSSDEVEESILKMGDPKKIAQAYIDRPRALIAPPLLDVYLLVLKIVIPAVSFGLIIANVISVGPNSNIGSVILNVVGQIWSATLTVIGMMTIIFGLLYKYLPDKDLVVDEKWSVKDLEKAPEEKEKVSIVELIFGIAFAVIGLIFFNGSSLIVIGDSVDFIPIINRSVIQTYLPLINISLLLSILLNVYLLVLRKWQLLTRLISIALDVFGLFIFGLITFNPNFFDFSKIPGISPTDSIGIVEGVQTGIKVGLVVVAIFVAIDIIKHIKIIIKSR